MGTPLEHILMTHYKVDMIAFMDSHPEYFEEAITLALADLQPQSMRAASLVWSCMKENDPRIQEYLKDIINLIPDKHDGHCRELLKILLHMKLSTKVEGVLFDFSVTLWKNTKKKPSVRYAAFQIILKITKKYPDLFQEIMSLTDYRYLDSLSPGIKRAVKRIMKELSQQQDKSGGYYGS